MSTTTAPIQATTSTLAAATSTISQASSTSTGPTTTASDSLTDLIPTELFDSAKLIVVGFSVFGVVIAIILGSVIACRYYRYRVSEKGRRKSIMGELTAEYKKNRDANKKAERKAKLAAKKQTANEKKRLEREAKDWEKRRRKFGDDIDDEQYSNGTFEASPSIANTDQHSNDLGAHLLEMDGGYSPANDAAATNADRKRKSNKKDTQTLDEDELLSIPYPMHMGSSSSSDNSAPEEDTRRRRYNAAYPSPSRNKTRYVPHLPNPIQKETSTEMWSAHQDRGAVLEDERWLRYQQEEFGRISKIPILDPLTPLNMFKDADQSKLDAWKPSSPSAECRFVSDFPLRL